MLRIRTALKGGETVTKKKVSTAIKGLNESGSVDRSVGELSGKGTKRWSTRWVDSRGGGGVVYNGLFLEGGGR